MEPQEIYVPVAVFQNNDWVVNITSKEVNLTKLPIITGTEYNRQSGYGEIRVLNSSFFQCVFKDVVIIGNLILDWNWAPHGPATMMHHNPGYRPEDIKFYLRDSSYPSHHLILSKGRDQKLQITDEVLPFIKNLEFKEIYMLETLEAIKLYNELASKGEPVVAFIHATC